MESLGGVASRGPPGLKPRAGCGWRAKGFVGWGQQSWAHLAPGRALKKAQVHTNSGRESRTRYKVTVHCLPAHTGGGYGLIYRELAREVGGRENAEDMKTEGVWPPVRAKATCVRHLCGGGQRCPGRVPGSSGAAGESRGRLLGGEGEP